MSAGLDNRSVSFYLIYLFFEKVAITNAAQKVIMAAGKNEIKNISAE